MVAGLVGFALFDSDLPLRAPQRARGSPARRSRAAGHSRCCLARRGVAWQLDARRPAIRRDSVARTAFVPLAFALVERDAADALGPARPEPARAGVRRRRALSREWSAWALTVKANAAMLVRASENALTDALTGLGNRRRLMEDLERGLEDEQRILVAIFDLNGFKVYNDTFGHPAGDALLERLATPPASRPLPDSAPPTGWAGTSSLSSGRSTAADAGRVLELSAEALAESRRGLHDRKLHTAPRGSPRTPTTVSEILSVADQRLYLQKAGGRHSTDAAERGRPVARARGARAGAGVAPGRGRPALCGGRRVHGACRRGDLEALRHAAQLHDVGKVAIPDAILVEARPARYRRVGSSCVAIP